MISYPISFYTQLDSPAGIESSWSSKTPTHEHTCSIPTEFEGPGGGCSPEDFFALALSNCLVATFKVYAQHSKVTYEKLEVKGELIVDLNENKKPIMKECHLNAKLYGPNNADLAKRLLQRAFESGFILNSVKTNLNLNVEIL